MRDATPEKIESVNFDDLPDWRSKSAYPDTQNFSPSQWAWEFLRRTEDYRRGWIEYYTEIENRLQNIPYLVPYISKYEHHGGIAKAIRSACTDLRNQIMPTGLWEMTDTERTKIKSFSETHAQQYWVLDEIERKSMYRAFEWHLRDMLDPTKSCMSRVEFNFSPVSSETGTERGQRQNVERLLLPKKTVDDGSKSENTWLNMPFQLHMLVDMRTPIGVLKEYLMGEVEKRYKEVESLDFERIEKRLREVNYLRYLRVLDAIKAGAATDEIGFVLYEGQYAGDIAALRKQVRNTIEQAQEAQEDYWRIAACENPGKSRKNRD